VPSAASSPVTRARYLVNPPTRVLLRRRSCPRRRAALPARPHPGYSRRFQSFPVLAASRARALARSRPLAPGYDRDGGATRIPSYVARQGHFAKCAHHGDTLPSGTARLRNSRATSSPEITRVSSYRSRNVRRTNRAAHLALVRGRTPASKSAPGTSRTTRTTSQNRDVRVTAHAISSGSR
jgi:hypothetical protein